MRLLYLGGRDQCGSEITVNFISIYLEIIVNFSHLISTLHFPQAVVCIMETLIRLLCGWSLLGVPPGCSSAGSASSLKQGTSCKVNVNSICSEFMAREHKTTLIDQTLFQTLPLSSCPRCDDL